VHIGIAIFERFLDLEHVTVGEGRRSNADRVAGPDGHIGEIAIEESAQIQVRRIWRAKFGYAGERNIGSGRVEPRKVGEITGKIAKDVVQIGIMGYVFPRFTKCALEPRLGPVMIETLSGDSVNMSTVRIVGEFNA
jgi:hypothetical protein